MLEQKQSQSGCIAWRAPYPLKAPVEQAQVFVGHVDGELAEAFLQPGAEAAGVGPTARPYSENVQERLV